jgi:hypothetical protein
VEDPVARTEGTQRYIDSGEYEGEYVTKQWGVRMPDGDLHYGLSQGDAENLEIITGGQLVRWSNDGWEDVWEE